MMMMMWQNQRQKQGNWCQNTSISESRFLEKKPANRCPQGSYEIM